MVALKRLRGAVSPGGSGDGSRNAVVALKREIAGPPGPGGSRKQERRGGIETIVEGLDAWEGEAEAGTPWWH